MESEASAVTKVPTVMVYCGVTAGGRPANVACKDSVLVRVERAAVAEAVHFKTRRPKGQYSIGGGA